MSGDYDSLREDLHAAVAAMSNYAAAVNRREDATTVELQRLWNDFAELRDEVLAVANRLEALTNFVVSDPAEVAAKIVNDANRATLAALPANREEVEDPRARRPGETIHAWNVRNGLA